MDDDAGAEMMPVLCMREAPVRPAKPVDKEHANGLDQGRMQQSRSRAQTCICRAAVLDLCVAATVTMLVKLYVLPKGSMEKDSGDDSVPYGTFVLNIISWFFYF